MQHLRRKIERYRPRNLTYVMEEMRAYHELKKQGYTKQHALYYAQVKIVEAAVNKHAFTLWTP